MAQRDVTTQCPHCDEEISIFHCSACNTAGIRKDEEETCSECEHDFCPEHVDDHECEGEDDEDEPNEADIDE